MQLIASHASWRKGYSSMWRSSQQTIRIAAVHQAGNHRHVWRSIWSISKVARGRLIVSIPRKSRAVQRQAGSGSKQGSAPCRIDAPIRVTEMKKRLAGSMALVVLVVALAAALPTVAALAPGVTAPHSQPRQAGKQGFHFPCRCPQERAGGGVLLPVGLHGRLRSRSTQLCSQPGKIDARRDHHRCVGRQHRTTQYLFSGSNCCAGSFRWPPVLTSRSLL